MALYSFRSSLSRSWIPAKQLWISKINSFSLPSRSSFAIIKNSEAALRGREEEEQRASKEKGGIFSPCVQSDSGVKRMCIGNKLGQ